VRVTAVVAARNEGGRVGATVRAILRIEAVDDVVVADGGSDDGTAQEARSAGARVLVGPRGGGKGGSLEGALARIEPADVYLLLDADLVETAVEGRVVLDEVIAGRADLAIGVLPRQPGHGGFRLVKRTARGLVRALSGFRPEEPLSGQRALTREVMGAVRPLAPGFGVEAGMTVDAVRAGFRVAEVPIDMTHAVTGRTIAGFRHRARQGWDLLRAMLRRAVRPR
jgi:Glycosyl transferase family 2